MTFAGLLMAEEAENIFSEALRELPRQYLTPAPSGVRVPVLLFLTQVGQPYPLLPSVTTAPPPLPCFAATAAPGMRSPHSAAGVCVHIVSSPIFA